MKMLWTASLCLIFSLATIAGEHPLSKISGTNIDLVTKGHSIAGNINGKLIIGEVSTVDGHKTSTLIMQTNEGLKKTIFSATEQGYGGVINSFGKELNISLDSINGENYEYIMNINGEKVSVRVEFDDFANNHFINPVYIMEINGEEIRAHMEDGQACWMYSLHLIFMIFGTYLA